MELFDGVIVAGYGVASGRSKDERFPEGAIRMQQPFFLRKGIDLTRYYPGTLNVDLAPLVMTPKQTLFDERVRWHDSKEERFALSKVELDIKGCRYAGLWYYPYPDTKTEHYQPDSVVELLLPWIEGLCTGKPVIVGFEI